MVNLRFIFRMLGSMFILETFFLLLAVGVGAYYGEDLRPLLFSAGILIAAGLLFRLLGCRANLQETGTREGMLIVTLTWVGLSFFGMLPFYLGGYLPHVADAFFETMSGFTTTGASVLTNVEALPHGILFWRSLTQWQGGIGMVVFTVALLPLFGGGVSQMFDAETTGAGVGHERFRPHVTQVAKRLCGIYIGITTLAVLLLWIGPMNGFDAVNQAMATVSTGGFSTKNASIAYWHSPYVEYVITAFMFIGSLNMTLLYFFVKGNFRKLFDDAESRAFFFIILLFTALTVGWLYYRGFARGFEPTLREAVFHVVSLVSSTGFMTTDYIPWGSFFCFLVLILMFVGGCAGSTSGGLKVGRFVIIYKHLSNVFLKQMHPNAVRLVRMNGHAVSTDNVYRCLAFAFIYIGLILFGSLLLTFDGSSLEAALGDTFSAIGNVGPGLGAQGPAGNYAALPALSKWVLSFLMLAGRLELFTVLSLFLPNFWKK